MKQRSLSKALMKTSLIIFKPFVKVTENKYFQEIKPLLYLEWALGRLPYSFDEQGLAPFKLFSFSVLYTIVFFVVQTVWTIYTLCTVVYSKICNAPSYDVTLFWVSIAHLLILILITPFTKWLDSCNLVKFVRSWHDFQENHMNSEIKMTLSWPIRILAALILPFGIVFVVLERFLITDLSFLHLVPFVISISETFIAFVWWCATFYELRAVTRTLLTEITMTRCRRISTYRRSWLELSNLVSAVGEAHAYTGLAASVIFFSVLVLSTYTLLSSFFEPSKTCADISGLLAAAVISFICIFILCDAAHRTTQELGPNFSSKLLALDLSHLDLGETDEMCLFLQTMLANPPRVGYLGFMTVNRNWFIRIISNTVTYLVVLIQFKASPLLNAMTTAHPAQ